MQCKYADVWLTGLPWQEDCGAVQLSLQQLIDAAPLFRSATPFVEARGNRAGTIAVPVILDKGNWMTALQYCHEIFWLLPGSGELVFIEQWGTDVLTITYPFAALQSSEPSRVGQEGVQVTHTFVLKGAPTFDTVTGAELRITTETGAAITTES
jgi:hypothetical protein